MKSNKIFIIITLIITTLLGTTALLAESQDLSAEGNKNLRSGNMHLSGQRVDKALPLFENVLSENPHSIEALQNLAAIYYDAKMQYYVSYDYYLKANKEIQSLLDEYEELKKSDEKAAKKFYRSNIKKPKFNKSFENNALFMKSCWIKAFKNGQNFYTAEAYDESLDEYTKLLEIAPDSIKTIKMISNIYLKTENIEKAIEYLIILSEKEPENINIIQQIASIKLDQEKYDESAQWFIKATLIEPDNGDNYFNAAICYVNAKNDEKAYEFFAKTAEVDPTNMDAILNANYKAAALGNDEGQIKFLKLAIEVDGSVNNVKDLCYILIKIKNFVEAKKYGGMWLELEPNSKEAKDINNFINQSLK